MADYTQEQLTRAMNKAKVGIMLRNDSVFIGTILFSLMFQWDTGVKTGEVDGKTLKINPNWFMGLNPKQHMAALAHYAWHVAFEHNSRIEDFPDKDKFNKAADYVNNILLKDAGYDLPEGFEYDSAHRNMSTDQVYKIIDPPEQQPQGSPGGGQGDGDGDGGYDRDVQPVQGDGTEQGKEQAKQEIQDMIVKANTQAQMEGQDAGNLPGEIKRMLDELLNPKLDWKTILQNYMNTFQKEDYSWSRPNRRFLPEYYLPSLHSEAMGHLSVLVDTSCSIGPKEFAAFLTEINSIKESLNPSKLTVVSWDTRVNNVDELNQDEQVSGNVDFVGGGGTDIQDTFDWLRKHQPEVSIIFTDGYYHERSMEGIEGDVIWMIFDNDSFTAEKGKVITYEFDHR